MKKLRDIAMALGLLALSGQSAAGAEQGAIRSASGTVVAVTPASRTIVVESQLRGQPWTIGAEVTEETKIEGKAKGLVDLKPGDKVAIQWVREEHRLVARSISMR